MARKPVIVALTSKEGMPDMQRFLDSVVGQLHDREERHGQAPTEVEVSVEDIKSVRFVGSEPSEKED